MPEEWRTIDEFPNYEISSLGRVRKYLKGWDCQGYTIVSFVKGKKRRSIHRLVADAFLGPRPPGQHVNHKDSNRAHNAVTNLEYVTPSENSQHAVRQGRWNKKGAGRGEQHPRSKLSWDLVAQIRQSKDSDNVWAKRLGVSKSTVEHARTGRSWKCR